MAACRPCGGETGITSRRSCSGKLLAISTQADDILLHPYRAKSRVFWSTAFDLAFLVCYRTLAIYNTKRGLAHLRHLPEHGSQRVVRK